MSSSGSRTWLLAAAALAIGGGIYYLNFKKNDCLTAQTKREIKALGPALKDASGKVSFDYLKALYIIALKAANDRFESTRVNFTKKRRDLLINGYI